MSKEVVLDPLRSHHNSKAVWCPVCPLAEAPPFKHFRLKTIEVGCSGDSPSPKERPLIFPDATEVYHDLEAILGDIEALTSEALSPAIPGTGAGGCTLIVLLTGRVAEFCVLRHGLVSAD
eukprot:5529444-Amphidinium_carterae.1